MGLRERLKNVSLAQRVYRRVKWYGQLQFTAAPWSVALETSAPCNRKCTYCPVSIHERTGEMSRELFEKIIADLERVGFARTLSFHFYNEPLMDERLPELVAHARGRLPECTMDIFTNGDFLTAKWIDDLFGAGIDVVRVSLHSANSEKHVRKILAEVPDEYQARMRFDSFFDREETGGFLYNRIEMADALPRTVPVQGLSEGCSLVNSLNINYEGQTALCCNDFFAANGHGSLEEESVSSLWRRSRPVRRRIYFGEYDKPICHTCVIGT